MDKRLVLFIGGFVIGMIISFFYVNAQYQNQANGANRPAINKEDLPPGHPPVENDTKAAATSKIGPLEAYGAPKGADKASQPAETAEKSPESSPKASTAYKNLQILKDLPANQIMVVMKSFTEGLGVNCVYCHVSVDEPAKDDKPTKGIARKMLTMVRDINKGYPTEGQVTCYTCHRGAVKPAS